MTEADPPRGRADLPTPAGGDALDDETVARAVAAFARAVAAFARAVAAFARALRLSCRAAREPARAALVNESVAAHVAARACAEEAVRRASTPDRARGARV